MTHPRPEQWVMYAWTLDGFACGYLESFDPDYQPEGYDDGWRVGRADFTTDPDRARRFPSAGAVMETWRTRSTRIPTRPDGKPNRPLTAFTVEPRKIA